MRRKKVDATVAPPANQPPPGFKQVTKTEKFMEPVGQAEEKQTILIPPSDVQEIEEPLDRFEEFFARVREQQGWTLMVFRLDSFSKDGKASPRSNNTYIGRMMFDPDTYLDDVQQMCPEGGAFRLQAKDPDGKFSEQWFEQIAPVKTPKQAAGNTHYFIQQPSNGEPPEPPRDTLKELVTNLKAAKEIRELFSSDTPTVQAVPVQATVEREPLQERIIGAALESVFKSSKPETAEEILRAYISPQKEEGWAELIKEVVKPIAGPLMNMLGGLLAAYMQNQARTQAGAQAAITPSPQPQIPAGEPLQPWPPQQAPFPAMEIPQNAPVYDTFQGGTIASPVPQGPFYPAPNAVPENPITDEDEEEMGRDDLIYKLADMLEECVRRAVSDPEAIERGREEVQAYKRRFPLITGTIDALTTLPPEAIIGMLSLKVPEISLMINNKVAIQTIRDFQEALKRPEVVQ